MTTATAPTAGIPVGPGLSMFDPIFVGIDEFGQHVNITLAYRNLLAGGEPGGGKSGLLNTIAAHAALSVDSRLVLLDGKLVELGQWEDCADAFIGPDITEALAVLKRLQLVMNNRYAWLRAHGRRKVTAADGLSVITVLVDEIAFYSATVGSKQEQEEFVALLRDLVARGRAAGIPVVAATQRPSFDIIPTSLRDLFGYRAAFRCTTPNSSNIVLGHGWAEQGYTATDIQPTNQGAAYLIAEGGTPPPPHQGRLSVRRADRGHRRLRRLDPSTPPVTGPGSGPHPRRLGGGGMTTRERTYTRANQQRAAQYAEIWVVAQPAEIAAMVRVASASGRLVYVGPPQLMEGDDTRHRRYLRLRTR